MSVCGRAFRHPVRAVHGARGRWFYVSRQARRRGGPRIAFGPGPVPGYVYVMWKTIRLLGGSSTGLDDPRADVRVAWLDETWVPAVGNALNGRCVDISKRRVDEAQRSAFGYGASLDPTQHVGPAVRKSEINGVHDGAIVVCPLLPQDDAVYQRLINNECDDGMVEDLRVVIAGSAIPVVYRKRRRAAVRFTNANAETLVESPSIFAGAERESLLAVARDVGLDFGELDVLRDTDGRLYVVDVNKTPIGPPNGLDRRAGRRAMVTIAEGMRPLLSGER